MGTGGDRISYVESEGQLRDVTVTLQYSNGDVAGYLGLHETKQEDGSLRAQLELRFENQSSALTAPEVGMDTSRYSPGRTWVLVEMAPRQSFTEPMRFSIHIPRKAPDPRRNIGDIETATAELERSREAMAAVRARCGYPGNCHYPICDMAPFRSVGQLADDGCVTSVVTLAAQSLHPQGPGS